MFKTGLNNGAKTLSRTLGLFGEINRTIRKNLNMFPMQELVEQRSEQFKRWVSEPNTCPRNIMPNRQRKEYRENRAMEALSDLPGGYTKEGRELYGPYYHETKSASMLDSICKDSVLIAGMATYGDRTFSTLVTSAEQLQALPSVLKPGVLFFTEKPLEVRENTNEVVSAMDEKQIKIHIAASWDTKQWRKHELNINQVQENNSEAPKPFVT